MNSLTNHSDMDLLSLLMEGDRQAFEVIYNRYVGRLYSYARKSISAQEDCEEIIQEVFESLWARHENLDIHALESNTEPLRSYLFTMVKYKVIRYFQHSKVRQKFEEHFRLFEAVYDNVMDVENEPTLIQAILEKGLAGLPERCQQAMRLRLVENLSNDDIAKRMNIKKTTVEFYMVTAVGHLKANFRTLYKAM